MEAGWCKSEMFGVTFGVIWHFVLSFFYIYYIIGNVGTAPAISSIHVDD